MRIGRGIRRYPATKNTWPQASPFLGVRRVDGAGVFLAGFCFDPMAEMIGDPL
jgi:hypothetical protein